MANKYICDISILNNEKIKSINGFNIIHEKYSKFNKILKVSNELEPLELFKKNIELGKEIYWETYRSNIVETKNEQRSTVLGFVIKISFSKDFLIDNINSMNKVNKFIEDSNIFMQKYFSVIEGYQDANKLYYICSANMKHCFMAEKLKEMEKKRRTFDDLKDILSFNLIFPTSYENSRKQKVVRKSDAINNMQKAFKKEVASPNRLTKVVNEPTERLSKVQEDDYKSEIEELKELIEKQRAEVRYLKNENDRLLDELDKQGSKMQVTAITENERKQFEELTRDKHILAKFLHNSNIGYEDVINQTITKVENNSTEIKNLRENYNLLFNTLKAMSRSDMDWEYVVNAIFDKKTFINKDNTFLKILNKNYLLNLKNTDDQRFDKYEESK